MEGAPCYTLIHDADDSGDNPTEQTLRKDLEMGKVPQKIDALKKLIRLIIQGEKFPNLLMVIIRFVMPCDDHTIKKLLLIYWEIVPKTKPDGHLLHELILVCDAYRKDLQHPNEFIRGSTLRFLCKLKEPELLEPLMPSIQSCLEHRHQYVRRNAVLAIYTIFKNFENLIPDAPSVIAAFLDKEQNAACKRNAFMMLIAADQTKALDYLSTCIEQVGTFNDILQLVIVELVVKVCRTDASQRGRFIRCIYNLLNSESAAVRYDAAGALTVLSSAPPAVTAAASTFIDLIVKESDNTVKLIVLDRLIDMKNNPQYASVIQSLVMDVMRVLATTDLQVRKKTLSLVMDLLSNKNVAEVVLYLQKEVSKTNSADDFDKTTEYRQLLVRALHRCGVRFPDIAGSIVPQLMEFLSDGSAESALDVILFVREAFERLPQLHTDMLRKLLDGISLVKSSKVLRASWWIIGEFARKETDIKAAFTEILKGVGTLPILDSELHEMTASEDDKPTEETKVVTKTRITADGTYATESVYTATPKTVKAEKPVLRQNILAGEWFLGCVLATALTKMALRYAQLENVAQPARYSTLAHAMFVISSIIRVGKSTLPTTQIDADSLERMMNCLRVLSQPTPELTKIFSVDCHATFVTMLNSTSVNEDDAKATLDKKKHVEVQADDLINFRALRVREENELEDSYALNLTRATGQEKEKKSESKLSKVFQLSGFSDPLYAEAYVHVNQYDIFLDVIVVNQTPDTLQNLTIELATLGDLKLTEKATSHTLGPHDFCNIKANVKVSSTETGIIFGNIVYDTTGANSDRNCVILNDIHIDIMDYITPAVCTEIEFRAMWEEFEWENKVTVRTAIPSLRSYLDHLVKNTNMRCLTPESALEGDCDFLAANLYARSVFGEDALANLSIEKGTDGAIIGHIRIRSKTQGIALSLGDKITQNQKNNN